MRPWAVAQRVVRVLAVSVVLAAIPAGAAWADGDEAPASVPDTTAAARRREAREAAQGAGYDAQPGLGLGALFSRRSGMAGTALMAVAFYFLFMRGQGGGGGSASSNSGWGSYYLFWIVAPALLAVVSSHPAILLVIVVAFVARRWLPDPFLALRLAGRVRSLQTDVAANPGNITARRDLASLWLEKRRPARAAPLLEQALARDPNSRELLFLSGIAQLHLRRPERAVEAFVTVTHQEPGFRYGDAYLRAADALIALGRWDDAEDALDHYLKIMSSSIEAHYKRAKVCKARKDDAGARQARVELREVWRSLPAYQRRRQLGWYLRALVT